MRRIYGIIIAILFLLTSCTKSSTSAQEAQSPKPAANTVVQAAATTAPWYKAKLEALGFSVFPEPQALPPLAVQGLDGKKLQLSDLKGKVILLNFWATWCPPCRKEMPSIQNLFQKMDGTNFVIVAISVQEKLDTVKTFLKTNKYTFPIYTDESGQVSGQFVSRGIPTTYIIDKDGKAIAGMVGAREYDGPEIIAIFKDLAK